MILLGTIVNVLLVLIGGVVGLLLKAGISKRFSDLMIQSIGLVTGIIGITYAIRVNNILIVIISLIVGAIIGETINIDKRLNRLGEWMKKKGKGENAMGEAMVTATLLFCVGAMAIMGSLDSGLRQNHDILYTKSIMDGIAGMLFASTMGVGVLFSAIPLAIYQGSITLLAHLLEPYLSEAVILYMNGVGGILLIGLSLSILEIKKIKVANLLPAIFIPIFLSIFL
jgi:hypothetical protein